jgi:hypothetical protein
MITPRRQWTSFWIVLPGTALGLAVWAVTGEVGWG